MENEILPLSYSFGTKKGFLYRSKTENSPLLLLNTFEGEGKEVFSLLRRKSLSSFNLLVRSNLDWGRDRTPWKSASLPSSREDFKGGADFYLKELLDVILPRVGKDIFGTPKKTCLVGYSLAGLFSLYSLYRCPAFDYVGSRSGSLWYPGFEDYCLTHPRRKKPEGIYLSLGDREKKAKNPLLSSVEEKTDGFYRLFRKEGIPTVYELNPGNHFQDADIRIAQGILWILNHCQSQD